MMIRIAIICLLISLVNSSTECDLNENQLLDLRDALNNASTYMEDKVRDEDAAICIGIAKSGKSTLINYLIGNTLIAKKKNHYDTIKLYNNDVSKGPVIGNESTSETTIPTKWNSTKLPNLTLWDTPGFDDNRGPVQDITNAFYLNSLVKHSKSLKFILVVNYWDLSNTNINQFTSVLEYLAQFFGKKFEKFFPSISIIFSKVHFDKSIEQIKGMLYDKIISATKLEMSQDARNFVTYIYEHEDHIALFKRPRYIDIPPESIYVNIIPAIENSPSIEKEDIQDLPPIISENSQFCLFEAREDLFKLLQIEELSRKVTDVFEKKLKLLKDLREKRNTSEIIKIQNDSMKIERNLLKSNEESNVLNMTAGLQNIDDSVKKFVDDYRFLTKLELIIFVGYCLNITATSITDTLNIIINTIVETALLKAKEVIFKCSYLLGNITNEQLTEERNEIEKEHNKTVEKLKKDLTNATQHNQGFFSYFWNSIKEYVSKCQLTIKLIADYYY